MIASGPERLAIRGEGGVDLFLRISDAGQKRARFRCIATFNPETDTLNDHEPDARRDGETLTALARGLAEDALLGRNFALADASGWPCAAQAGGDPLRLFLYIEFFRAWQVADMAAQRFVSRIESDVSTLPLDPAELVQAVVPIFDFNRLTLGLRATDAIQPVLATRIATPGWGEPRGSGSGYALRMLGDLCLRAGDAARAQRCFESAVAAGDNPFRRRKAIEAAHAARDYNARDAHLVAYSEQWPLPADLAALHIAEKGHP